MFKAPVALYRDGPSEILRRRCVMLLTTTGRKSGLPRTGGVSFMPLEDHFVVFSGWGVRSDWYQNLLADPAVTLQVGRRRIPATAVPAAAAEHPRPLLEALPEPSRPAERLGRPDRRR